MTTGFEPREAAERTGLSIDTLRYYEKEGLVGPVARQSGRRRYSADDLAWVELIGCLREAGLGISDLRDFTTMLRGGAPAGDRVEFLRARRAELRRRAGAIATALTVLDEKIVHFAGGE